MKMKYTLFVVFGVGILAIVTGVIFTMVKLDNLSSGGILSDNESISEKGQDQESKDRGFEQIKPIKIGDRQYKVAFLGDQGMNANSKKVMEMLKTENVGLVVQLGDFDYEDNPAKWRNLFTDTLGENIPVLAVMGNHDVKRWEGYKGVISNFVFNTKEAFKNMSCTGDIGRNYACKDDMFHFVMVSPGMTTTDHVAYIKSEFATSTSLWRICTWHYNQSKMQLGLKKDEAGWGVYEACRESGAMIFTGHDHTYARSYLLSSTINTKVATTSDVLVMKPGVTFVTVSGLGGHSVRGQNRNDPWWAATYTAKQSANAGAVICTFGIGIKDIYADVKDFDLGKAGCYFRDIKGFTPDAYYLETTFGKK